MGSKEARNWRRPSWEEEEDEEYLHEAPSSSTECTPSGLSLGRGAKLVAS